MTIEERTEIASAGHNKGYNCCQSVVLACKDLVDVPEETLLKVSSGFGAGMGTMDGICGALAGAGMIAGLMLDGDKKKAVPKTSQILRDFQSRCGAILCKDLKGRDTRKVICSCDECIRNGVRSLMAVMDK